MRSSAIMFFTTFVSNYGYSRLISPVRYVSANFIRIREVFTPLEATTIITLIGFRIS